MRKILLTLVISLLITSTGFCAEHCLAGIEPVGVKGMAVEETFRYACELYLRGDYSQAVGALKSILAMDACNEAAREQLGEIAKKGVQADSINAFLKELNCPAPEPLPKVSVETEPILVIPYYALTPKPFKLPQHGAELTITGLLKSIIDYKDQNIAELKERLAKELTEKTTPVTTQVPSAPLKISPPAPQTAPITFEHKPLQGATLQEKFADLQSRLQRIEKEAQANNARVNTIQTEVSNLQK